jgi:hypothetical protein
MHDGNALYDVALQLANEVGVEESKLYPIPTNKPSKTVSYYYKIYVTIPLLAISNLLYIQDSILRVSMCTKV